MDSGKVVYLGSQKGAGAKEYAVLVRLVGEGDVQFKVFGADMEDEERQKLAKALERAAQSLRLPNN